MKCTNPNEKKCDGEIVTRAGRYQECSRCGFRPAPTAKSEQPKPQPAAQPKPQLNSEN